MVTKTYISKCNTIVKDDNVNLGINPVAELNFGRDVSRILLYFDLCKLHSLVEDKTYPDISKLRHELILYNCASLDNTTLDKKLLKSDYQGLKERASSCDVILFLIPNNWDGGRGFDWTRDATLTSTYRILSLAPTGTMPKLELSGLMKEYIPHENYPSSMTNSLHQKKTRVKLS